MIKLNLSLRQSRITAVVESLWQIHECIRASLILGNIPEADESDDSDADDADDAGDDDDNDD